MKLSRFLKRRSFRKVIAAILCVYVVPCGLAQSVNLRNYDPRAGLSSSETYFAIQDRSGYIWIASDAGVNRFDGKNFKRFTRSDGLPDNTIFVIHEDLKGRIWFLSYSGALSYFYRDSIHVIGANDSIRKLTGYQNEIVESFEVDRGDTLWISYNYRPFYIKVLPDQNHGKLQIVHHTPEARNLIIKRGHLRPIYTSQAAYSQFSRTRIELPHETFTYNIENKYPHNPTAVRLLAPDSANFFMAISDELSHFRNGKLVAQRRLSQHIIGLNTDKKGDLWVCVYHNGVYRFRQSDIRTTPEQHVNRLSVTSVLEDHENGYWFTTLEKGIFYAPSILVRALHLKNEEGVSTMAANEHELFIGSVSGEIARIRYNKTNNTFSEAGAIRVNSIKGSISQIRFHESNLNFSLGKGLVSVNLNEIADKSSFTVQPGVIYDKVEFRPNGNQLRIYDFRFVEVDGDGHVVWKDSLPTRIKLSHLHSDGEVYAGGMTGLWRLKFGKYEWLGDRFPELRNPVKAMLTDNNGILWVCTKGAGVIALKNDTIKIFDASLGVSNNCTSIVYDPRGHLWVGSNTGLYEINPVSGKVNHFTDAHGLRTNEIRALACYKGHLFIGTPLGVDYFPLSENLANGVPPPVIISAVHAGGKSLKLKDTLENISFDQNDLEFSFAGFSFKSGTPNNYVYHLDGFDRDWLTTTNENLKYTNLPPGRYTFRVSLTNNDGISSSSPASIVFTVLKPWWKESWALLIFVAAGITAIAVIVIITVRSTRTRQARKARMEQLLIESRLTALRAQMNPHFTFNVINSIQHFILHNNKEKAYDYLARFSRLVRMVLDNSRYTTVPLSNEVQLLTLYVELERLRFENEFDFEIRVQSERPAETISLPNMLIQPYLENAIIHGVAPAENRGQIELIFTQKGDYLYATLTDNGIGRQRSRELRKNSSHKSAGMRISEERISVMGELFSSRFTVTINDLTDAEGRAAGTEVNFRIPLM